MRVLFWVSVIVVVVAVWTAAKTPSLVSTITAPAVSLASFAVETLLQYLLKKEMVPCNTACFTGHGFHYCFYIYAMQGLCDKMDTKILNQEAAKLLPNINPKYSGGCLLIYNAPPADPLAYVYMKYLKEGIQHASPVDSEIHFDYTLGTLSNAMADIQCVPPSTADSEIEWWTDWNSKPDSLYLKLNFSEIYRHFV
ncbi:hypothetical protein V1512DRAFT_275683 [Lipomyces arxii]|uniref:uncharacterized protein n=1 Tax=Lipomyces arxii TaxID=56418 RepID=UPI0034D00F07